MSNRRIQRPKHVQYLSAMPLLIHTLHITTALHPWDVIDETSRAVPDISTNLGLLCRLLHS